jgi:hypothetical protein
MNNTQKVDTVQFWTDFVESTIPIWESWKLISQYQRDIADNYREIFFNYPYRQFLQLAPSYLSQSINPWSFSLMQFTKEIKGSSTLEYKILTQVAGYGSQLGTIIDLLNVLLRKYPLEPDEMGSDGRYKFYRFIDLVEEIKKVKSTKAG